MKLSQTFTILVIVIVVFLFISLASYHISYASEFISIPKNRGSISLEEVLKRGKTGDIVLILAGDAPIPRRYVSAGRYTHIGILIRDEEERLHLRDTFVRKSTRLDDVYDTYHKFKGSEVVWRPLARELNSNAVKSLRLEFSKPCPKQNPLKYKLARTAVHWFIGIKTPSRFINENTFCSDLVANALYQAGCLDYSRSEPSSPIPPSFFSSTHPYPIETIETYLKPGISYADEYLISK